MHRSAISPESGCPLLLTLSLFILLLKPYAVSRTGKQKDTPCTCQPWSYFCGPFFHASRKVSLNTSKGWWCCQACSTQHSPPVTSQ